MTIDNFPAFVFAAMVVYALVEKFTDMSSPYFSLRKSPFSKSNLTRHTPILMSMYLINQHVLHAISGQIDDVVYRVYVTGESHGGHMSGGARLYVFELDFNTRAHLIGLGNDSQYDKFKLKSHLNTYDVEYIDLEGDFNQHFDLYAAQGQQTQARYVFDPQAMATYIDYCRYNFWEIVDNELHIVISHGHKNQQYVLQHAREFLRVIKPALTRELPSDPKIKHYPVYNQTHKKLPCPICHTKTKGHKGIFACKNNHGILLFGGTLLELRNGNNAYDQKSLNDQSHKSLQCPNCNNLMLTHKFAQKDFMIDTCTRCALRWLDSTEVAKVLK